ncbi:hypothetical protein, partial [Streptomyces sp. F-3]|uniref:hypothetical protein n=1 Tax=Streptomyces sp. F-3 TaxID=1840095 RepID=UPI000A7A7126
TSLRGPGQVSGSRLQKFCGRFVTGVCAVVLALGALVTGYVVLTAYAVEPDGPWDTQAVTNANVAAGIGLVFSALMAVLTWMSVKAEWLRKWWYVIPSLLVIAALLRLTLLGPEL